MKKWYAGVCTTSFLTLLVLGYYVMHNPFKESNITSPNPIFNTTNPLEWITSGAPSTVKNSADTSLVISADILVSDLFVGRNISNEEKQSLHAWNHLQHLVGSAQVLPNAFEATKEAVVAWKNLMESVEDESLHLNESSQGKAKEKQCLHYLTKMNATELDDKGFRFRVPRGLTQGSSITFIGIPHGLLGNFQFDFNWGTTYR